MTYALQRRLRKAAEIDFAECSDPYLLAGKGRPCTCEMVVNHSKLLSTRDKAYTCNDLYLLTTTYLPLISM